MSSLAIFDWNGSKREVRFIGWTDNGRTAFFIRDEQQDRRVILIRLPSRFDVHFCVNPIPDSEPTEIVRAALHLPPCVASKREADELLKRNSGAYSCAQHFEPWQLAARDILYLEPKDRNALSNLLDQEIQRRKREYINEERRGADFPPEECETRGRNLRDSFTTIDPDGKFVRVFDVTLDMEKQGNTLGVRDEFLCREWAKQFSFDLLQIEKDAAKFRHWIGRLAINGTQRTRHAGTGIAEFGRGLKLSEREWAVLETSVRYEIRLSDGTRRWLDGFDERPINKAEEHDVFDKLETADDLAAERVTLEDACRILARPNRQPITKKWLTTLCRRVEMDFKFPMRRGDFEKVRTAQQRRNRSHAEKVTKNLPKPR